MSALRRNIYHYGKEHPEHTDRSCGGLNATRQCDGPSLSRKTGQQWSRRQKPIDYAKFCKNSESYGFTTEPRSAKTQEHLPGEPRSAQVKDTCGKCNHRER